MMMMKRDTTSLTNPIKQVNIGLLVGWRCREEILHWPNVLGTGLEISIDIKFTLKDARSDLAVCETNNQEQTEYETKTTCV